MGLKKKKIKKTTNEDCLFEIVESFEKNKSNEEIQKELDEAEIILFKAKVIEDYLGKQFNETYDRNINLVKYLDRTDPQAIDPSDYLLDHYRILVIKELLDQSRDAHKKAIENFEIKLIEFQKAKSNNLQKEQVLVE